MSSKNRVQLEPLMDQLEEMWGHLNHLFNSLNATNGWNKKHGPDWTFADVPYHLAYCNHDVIVRPLEYGPDLPEEERELLASFEAVAAWNDRKFAERPADQTPAQSVAQWRASLQDVRRLVSKMDDVDLERPFWLRIGWGWVTTRRGLEWCRNHDCSEFLQLRIHMGLTEPVPSPEIINGFLEVQTNNFPMYLDRGEAVNRRFMAVLAFSDPGVGAWTIHVDDGTAMVSEGAVENADLLMTQSVESFVKSINRIHNPVDAVQAGEIQVNDIEALATFGKLFPM